MVTWTTTRSQGDNLGVLPGGINSKATIPREGQVGLQAPFYQIVSFQKKIEIQIFFFLGEMAQVFNVDSVFVSSVTCFIILPTVYNDLKFILMLCPLPA